MGIVVMKVFLIIVLVICILGIICSRNPKAERMFNKLFKKIFGIDIDEALYMSYTKRKEKENWK